MVDWCLPYDCDYSYAPHIEDFASMIHLSFGGGIYDPFGVAGQFVVSHHTHSSYSEGYLGACNSFMIVIMLCILLSLILL